MQLVDSHCHLDDRQFDRDREAVMERASAAGIKYMLSIGTGDGPPDLAAAVRLADAYACVFAAAGVHPNDALKADPNTFDDLEKLLQHPKIIALGEIGLDYHWGVPRDAQARVFARQLGIAAAARMPVVIHTREAWEDTLKVLRAEWAPTCLPCIMHCFTGNAEQASECLELGFYLAFGGVITFPKASEVREAARIVPAEFLLLETDSPYLAPIPHRGQRNEPSFVAHTAETIARVRQVPLETLAAQTTANFERLFQLADENIPRDLTS